MMTKDLKLANDAANAVNANTPLGKAALKIINEHGYAVAVEIDVPTYNVFSATTDEGKGLVYSDVITDSTVTDKFYYNILDYNNSTLQSSQDTLGSYFKVLSYK